MRILLIAPPFYRLFRYPNIYFPLGLGYVAASLRRDGHEVRILHADNDPASSTQSYRDLITHYPLFLQGLQNTDLPCWTEIAAIASEFKPDVVGSAAMTVYLKAAWRVLEIAKSVSPKVITVLGGPAVTINPRAAMSKPWVDFAVSGEGEVAAMQLVRALERDDPSSLCRIQGLSWRGAKGDIHYNGRAPWIDVDMVDFPARDLLAFKEYPADLYGTIVTARGCPYRCAFCNSPAIWGSRMRYRKPVNVLEELEETKERFGTRYFYFFDDVFAVNKRHTKQILQLMIEREVCIRYWCNTRLDVLDEELLDLMAQSGCDNLSVGVESGSDRILKCINKGISRSTIEEGLAVLERSGIGWSVFFMMGFPDESVEDLELTLSLMEQVKPPKGIVFSIFTPYQGTPLYEKCKKLNLIPEDADKWSLFSHQSPENYFIPNVPRDVFREYVDRAIAIADKSKGYVENL